MAIDKDPLAKAHEQAADDTSKEKKSKKKKRVVSGVPLIEVETAQTTEKAEKATGSEAETSAKKKRSRKSKSHKHGAPSAPEVAAEAAAAPESDTEKAAVQDDVAEFSSDEYVLELRTKEKKTKAEPVETLLFDRHRENRAETTETDTESEPEAALADEEPELASTSTKKPKTPKAPRQGRQPSPASEAAPADVPSISEELPVSTDEPTVESTPRQADESVDAIVGGTTAASLERERQYAAESKQASAVDLDERQLDKATNDIRRIKRDVAESERTTKRVKTDLERKLERLRTQSGQQKPEVSPKASETMPARPSAFEAAATKPKPVVEQVPEAEEQPKLGPDRRLETSAWHRIEVDKKTGKAVEDPTLAYGQEFNNEQHQEQLRKQVLEASLETESVKQAYAPLIKNQPSQPPVQPKPTPLGTDRFPQPQPTNTSFSRPTFTPPKMPAMPLQDLVLWSILGVIVIAIIAALTV